MMEWLECVNEVLCFLCGDGGCWCWGRRMIVEVCGCGKMMLVLLLLWVTINQPPVKFEYLLRRQCLWNKFDTNRTKMSRGEGIEV